MSTSTGRNDGLCQNYSKNLHLWFASRLDARHTLRKVFNMSTKDNGGPAFPHTDDMSPATRPGMTLRDWFAGQALAGLVVQRGEDRFTKEYAKDAWALADAMLAERNKE